MANFQSRYTGPEIDERLRKAGEAVLTEAQSLDAGKQAQARENIGAASSAALEGKVDKVAGKGLSTNDYTNQDKQVVDAVPGDIAGIRGALDTLGGVVATKYTKPSTGIPASDLAEGVIPDVSQFITKTVNDLTNYYLKTETYTKDEVQQLISTIHGFSYEVVATLPAASADTMGKIYLVPSADPQSQNIKDEYITIDNGASAQTRYTWEQIGSTAIDLSGYVTTQQLNTALAAYTTSADLATLLAAKQDTISDLADIRSGAAAGATAYQKPQGGIPASDLASGVIPDVSGFYTKPAGGIPATDLADKYAGSPSAGGPAFKALGIPYGAVDANSTSTAIKATVDNFPETLVAGVCAYIRNDVVSSASGFTLNINGTGALPVYQSLADASRVTTLFSAASTFLFVYNPTRVEGGCWDLYYGYNSNDNTVGYNLRTNGGTAVAAAKFYRYRLLFTAPDGQSLVPSNTSSSTSSTTAKTVNQAKIDPFAPIWYYSTTTAINAGSSASASYLWMQYSAIPLGYAFNRTGAALTMTARDPVYLKCAPQSDGSAIMDADTPIVQALPSTEDGKIYIFLGYAESEVNITLYYWHPVYYFKDGAIRQWTNAAATSNGVQDVTVGGTSVVSEGVAEIPAIPEEIDTVAVTVDNATGTPSASGSVSGGTLSLAFHNLKGEKGDTGATGAQGPQGNPGSSQDYPFTLANNLTTDDSTVALTAAQGVVLNNKWKLPDTQITGFKQGYISTNGTYSSTVNTGSSAASQCMDLTVEAGQVYNIFGTGGNNNYYRLYAIFASDGTRLDRETGSGYYNPKTVTIPTGGVHLVINLREYNAQTDKVMLVGSKIDAQTLQGEIDQTNEELSATVSSAEMARENKQASDIYAPILVDWMQVSHWYNGMTSVAQMQVVSSTSDSVTLTAAEAAAFAVFTPAVVGFSDGSYKVVYFNAYSGSGATITRASVDSTDLTNATTLQSLHDTVRGGAGIHLSPSGYLAVAQFTAAELAKRMSQKNDNLLAGGNFYFCDATEVNSQKKFISDTYGRNICTAESSFAGGSATGMPGGELQSFGINSVDATAWQGGGGWLKKCYYMRSIGTGQYNLLTFPAHGRGFIELQATLNNNDAFNAGYTGTATAEIIVDGVVKETIALDFIQKRYQIDNIVAKRTIALRLTNTSANPTRIAVYSFNFWGMTPAVDVPSLAGKKIAVLGDSWTQFPTSSQALADHASYNENVVYPDGTVATDGYGYFPKELARVTGATVDNWGKGGTRADNWGIPMIDTVLAHDNYDYVLIEFFVNDSNAGIGYKEWAANIKKICQRCIANGARPIFIVPCMDNGGTRRGGYHEYTMRGLMSLA